MRQTASAQICNYFLCMQKRHTLAQMCEARRIEEYVTSRKHTKWSYRVGSGLWCRECDALQACSITKTIIWVLWFWNHIEHIGPWRWCSERTQIEIKHIPNPWHQHFVQATRMCCCALLLPPADLFDVPWWRAPHRFDVWMHASKASARSWTHALKLELIRLHWGDGRPCEHDMFAKPLGQSTDSTCDG